MDIVQDNPRNRVQKDTGTFSPFPKSAVQRKCSRKHCLSITHSTHAACTPLSRMLLQPDSPGTEVDPTISNHTGQDRSHSLGHSLSKLYYVHRPVICPSQSHSWPCLAPSFPDTTHAKKFPDTTHAKASELHTMHPGTHAFVRRRLGAPVRNRYQTDLAGSTGIHNVAMNIESSRRLGSDTLAYKARSPTQDHACINLESSGSRCPRAPLLPTPYSKPTHASIASVSSTP